MFPCHVIVGNIPEFLVQNYLQKREEKRLWSISRPSHNVCHFFSNSSRSYRVSSWCSEAESRTLISYLSPILLLIHIPRSNMQTRAPRHPLTWSSSRKYPSPIDHTDLLLLVIAMIDHMEGISSKSPRYPMRSKIGVEYGARERKLYLIDCNTIPHCMYNHIAYTHIYNKCP